MSKDTWSTSSAYPNVANLTHNNCNIIRSLNDW